MPSISVQFVVWLGICEALPKPWEEDWVELDIEYLNRCGRKRPGRNALAKRWGWGEKRVRTKLYYWEGQGRASMGPEKLRKVKVAPSSRAKTGQPRAKSGPEENDDYISITINKPKGLYITRAVQEVWQYRKTWHGRQSDKPNVSIERCIRSRVRESGLDDVKLVIRWIEEAEETLWWRKNKRTGLGTILKADKWEDRLEQARTWVENSKPNLRVIETDPRDKHKDRAWQEVNDWVEANSHDEWDLVVDALRDDVGRQDTEIWLESARVVELGGDPVTATLAVPNNYYEEWICTNYLDAIQQASGWKIKFIDKELLVKSKIDQWVKEEWKEA